MDLTCINTIRTLSMDAVQKANSGHPGTPMALAPVAYKLWQKFFATIRPTRRGRIVIASCSLRSRVDAAVFALALHGSAGCQQETRKARRICGAAEGVEEISAVGQPHAGTSGIEWTSGVETTTGPLGQGVATSVGMAIASQWLPPIQQAGV